MFLLSDIIKVDKDINSSTNNKKKWVVLTVHIWLKLKLLSHAKKAQGLGPSIIEDVVERVANISSFFLTSLYIFSVYKQYHCQGPLAIQVPIVFFVCKSASWQISLRYISFQAKFAHFHPAYIMREHTNFTWLQFQTYTVIQISKQYVNHNQSPRPSLWYLGWCIALPNGCYSGMLGGHLS